MSSSGPSASRRVGMAVSLAFVALIAFGLLAREPSAGDRMYVLIRWPLWALALAVPPLLLVRYLVRRRRRAAGAAPDQP